MTWPKGADMVTRLIVAGELERITGGGHVVLYDAAMAQFDPPLGSLIRP